MPSVDWDITQPESSHAITRFFTVENCDQIVDCPKSHRIPGFDCGTADVRQQEDVIQLSIAGVDRIGFTVKNVEAGGPDVARLQCRDQGVVIDDSTARGIHQDRIPMHHGEAFAID